MAIIRTASSGEIAYLVATEVSSAILSGAVVKEFVALVEHIQTGAGEGSNQQGSELWRTEVSSSSASYIRTFDNLETRPGWSLNGTETFTLNGSNLDLSLEGRPAIATRFAFTASTADVANRPGLIGLERYDQQIQAVINFDLSGNWLACGNYTRTVKHSSSVSGFHEGLNLLPTTASSSKFASYAFTGVSEYELSASGSPSLLWSNTYAYQHKVSDSWSTVGTLTEPATSGSMTSLFQLNSATGLAYRADGSATLSGHLDGLLVDYKSRDVEEGAVRNLHLLYRFTDSAAIEDDIDPQVFLDYQETPTGSLLGLVAELFKGNDTIYVAERSDGGYIEAGLGNDRVIGSKAADQLFGGEGDDVIYGGLGGDYLIGGQGMDVIRGEAGDDFLDGGEGHDLLDGGAGNDWIEGGAGDDRLLGGAGNDRLLAGDGDDRLEGGSGNDLLNGGDGSDLLKGGAGQDRLEGGAGDDVIEGGAGNDYIVGGAGRDIMSGGTGIDGFAFDLGDSGDGQLSLGSLDQIKGFSVAQDRILLNLAFVDGDIQQLGRGASYEALLADAEALDSRIVVGYDGANTYVFADMDGNGSLDLAIQLLGIKGDAVAQALDIRSA